MTRPRPPVPGPDHPDPGKLRQLGEYIDASRRVRYLIWAGLAVVTVVALATVVALLLALGNANGVGTRATRALGRSTEALSTAHQNEAHIQANQAKLSSLEVLLCHRLNVHRVLQDDRNAYREWLFDRYFLGAVIHPLPGDSRPTVAQERQRRAAARYLRGIVDGMVWIPATNSCLAPGTGRNPVRFIDRQPTKAELALQSGQ